MSYHPALGIHFDEQDYLDLKREREESEELQKHFRNFWGGCDFESIFEIEELNASTPEAQLALGKKIAELYQADKAEYFGCDY